jgi:DNA-directed RNA polymerase subunit RPC12/RpoP
MLKKVKCARCGEELIAPEWSEPANMQELRHLWHCTECGYVFETLDPKVPLPMELAKQFLPSLVLE